VSLLFFVVVWGYQLNAMTVDTSESGGGGGGSAENRAMLLVYGIGLIVISGTACVYVAMRMTAVRPKRAAAEVSFSRCSHRPDVFADKFPSDQRIFSSIRVLISFSIYVPRLLYRLILLKFRKKILERS